MVLKKASSAERFLGTSDRRSLVTNEGAVEGAHTTCATVTASPALAIKQRLLEKSGSLFYLTYSTVTASPAPRCFTKNQNPFFTASSMTDFREAVKKVCRHWRKISLSRSPLCLMYQMIWALRRFV